MNAHDNQSVELVEATAQGWREASGLFLDFGYQMLWEYAEALASKHGALSERLLAIRGGIVVGMVETRVHRLPMRFGGIAYVASGPAVRRTGSQDADMLIVLRQTLKALRARYVERTKMTLRVRCPIGTTEWNDALRRVLCELGFDYVTNGRGYRTILINTTRPLDEINASFNKTWRKSLRRADRGGVATKQAKDESAFEHVVRMHDALRERKGFGTALDGHFYKILQRTLPERDKLIVILAEKDNETVGMNLVSAQGDTLTGIIGATTPIGAEYNAAYSLEWEAVRLAVELGLSRYDLGGIDPVSNPGVHIFKRGTHGEDVSAAGPMGLDPGPLRAAALSVAEWAYRTVLTRARRA